MADTINNIMNYNQKQPALQHLEHSTVIITSTNSHKQVHTMRLQDHTVMAFNSFAGKTEMIVAFPAYQI